MDKWNLILDSVCLIVVMLLISMVVGYYMTVYHLCVMGRM